MGCSRRPHIIFKQITIRLKSSIYMEKPSLSLSSHVLLTSRILMEPLSTTTRLVVGIRNSLPSWTSFKAPSITRHLITWELTSNWVMWCQLNSRHWVASMVLLLLFRGHLNFHTSWINILRLFCRDTEINWVVWVMTNSRAWRMELYINYYYK